MISTVHFLIIYLASISFAISQRQLSYKVFFILWLSILMFISFISRSSLEIKPETDFAAYAYNFEHKELWFYHIREIIFWKLGKTLFQLLQDIKYVFMAFDLIDFLILYTALYQLSMIILGKNSKVQYLFFSTILLIPYWTGLNNTYRQFFAVNVFLLISAVTFRASMKSKLLLLIPVLSHNATVLLLPGNILLTKDSIKKCITIFGLLLFPIVDFFGSY